MGRIEVSHGSPSGPILLVGYGLMGSAFGSTLGAAGHRLLAMDTSTTRVAQALADGMEVVQETDDHRIADVETVICSLPAEPSLDAVSAWLAAVPWTGSPIIIETSTLSLDAKVRARHQLEVAGLRMVDAPVSGTSVDARDRRIVVFASGDAHDLAIVRPVLTTLADRVLDLGSFGVGTQLKLLANHLVLVHTAAAAEMLALARSLGLDPALVLDAVASGAGTSRILESRGPHMVRRSYDGGCAIETLCKDVGLIDRLTDGMPCDKPLFDAAARLFRSAGETHLARMDGAAVHELYLNPPPTTATGL